MLFMISYVYSRKYGHFKTTDTPEIWKCSSKCLQLHVLRIYTKV